MISSGPKTTNTDIADTRTNHIGSIYRLNRNLITDNRKQKAIFDTLAHHTKMNFRALGATQTLHNLLFRHLHTSNGCIIDGNDAIASNNADLL